MVMITYNTGRTTGLHWLASCGIWSYTIHAEYSDNMNSRYCGTFNRLIVNLMLRAGNLCSTVRTTGFVGWPIVRHKDLVSQSYKSKTSSPISAFVWALPLISMTSELKELKGITYRSLNIRGLLRSVDDISILLEETKLDILLLQETLLCPSIDSSLLERHVILVDFPLLEESMLFLLIVHC